jgi:hypothetical protein
LFMLYAVPVGLALGFAMRGRLDGLAGVTFRWAPVFLGGLVAQLILFSDLVTERIGSAGPPLYVISTALVLLALGANWRIPGVPIILAGAACNFAAIISNGGYMPAGVDAMAALGKVVKTEYSNSALLANPNLAPLTDIFAMPRWLPGANIFSAGDVLIGVGVVVVIVAAMRPSLPRRTSP